METLTGTDTLFDTVGIAYQSSIQQLHPYLNNSTYTSSASFEIGVKRNRSEQEDRTLEVQTVSKTTQTFQKPTVTNESRAR